MLRADGGTPPGESFAMIGRCPTSTTRRARPCACGSTCAARSPRPAWPDGSDVRGFHASDGPRLHALLEHGYRNGGGSVEATTSGCRRSRATASSIPARRFLVEVGDELAAASICWTSGFVKDLVVHETWRRHGLGEALLRLAFRTFQARGAAGVELKVQGQNAPAIALYERVGMRTVERISEL